MGVDGQSNWQAEFFYRLFGKNLWRYWLMVGAGVVVGCYHYS